ncbi:MAG TPA: SAM-dependent methyltransferase, partial [Candidatus Kapabacteria bacterium]|nr:SAM-dependent methyltransferase [Candidatus Kapabacteria bacterium]
MTSGTLYIVSTPIGHDDDITLRALKVLNSCDVVVCEEMKEGATLLRKHKLSKQLEEFNEHSDDSRVHEIVAMLRDGKTIALISDCG